MFRITTRILGMWVFAIVGVVALAGVVRVSRQIKRYSMQLASNANFADMKGFKQ